jgi:enoyl-CoA hydratase/carnithine racemase
MSHRHITVESGDAIATVTMNRPERRNALSLEHMEELTAALRTIGASNARAVILAGNGPVFSSGHDFGDMVERDLPGMRRLFAVCAELMATVQRIPQPVIARVHGLATGAGCQLVATADLAVAAADARFATPGGRGGWFCTTPMVAVSRAFGRKRALEMLLTGDEIDAATAAEWGLVNRVVPAERLVEETERLARAASRGSAYAKGAGKQSFYAQIDLDQPQAYAYASEVMAMMAFTADGREAIRAFVEKRRPTFES